MASRTRDDKTAFDRSPPEGGSRQQGCVPHCRTRAYVIGPFAFLASSWSPSTVASLNRCPNMASAPWSERQIDLRLIPYENLMNSLCYLYHIYARLYAPVLRSKMRVDAAPETRLTIPDRPVLRGVNRAPTGREREGAGPGSASAACSRGGGVPGGTRGAAGDPGSRDTPKMARLLRPARRLAGTPARRLAGTPARRPAGEPARRPAGEPARRPAGTPARRPAGDREGKC